MNALTAVALSAMLVVVSAAAADPGVSRRPTYGTFGFDSAGMDRTVAPGDDFYAYANGTWQRSTEIPSDVSYFGMFERLQELSLDRTRVILDRATGQAGSQVGDFYASFMDEAGVEARGVSPVVPWLTAIAASQDKDALSIVMAQLQRQGVKTLFGVAVKQDDKVPSVYVARITQGGLGLPDRDYFLKDDEKLADIRREYPGYLAGLLTLSGETDVDNRSARIAAFEARIAASHWSRIDSRDADKTYNEWTRRDFTVKAPGFDWAPYLAELGLGQEQRFIISQPSAVAGEAKAWDETPLAVLKDYVSARVLASYSIYLSKAFVDASFAFSGTKLTGTPDNRPRWKRGVALVSAEMGEAIGRDYVAQYFPPAAKTAADGLVRNLIAAYRRRLGEVPWMAPETRLKALEKLASFTPKIGYPARWRDYAGLKIARDDLVGNVSRAEAFEYQRTLNHLGQPIDRSEWRMPPMTVNAYINFGLNEIVFPAAILQPPFFDPNADPAVNYGGIGVVIGHELSHHFDDQGRKYDKTGKLVNWWSATDAERFSTFTRRLVRQYSAYEPLPGEHVQGELTLGENIADVAGLTIAHQAYKMSLGGRPAPTLEGFSGDQRFYLGFAQIWRAKVREPRLRQQLLTDMHSPDRQRTYEVRNQDAWYNAFGVRPAQSLYLKKSERVQIW